MVLNDVYRVMAIDALVSSHPLSSPAGEVNTPAQISEMFDSISYSKVRRQRRAGRGSGDAAHRAPLWQHAPWPGPAGSAPLSETPSPSAGSFRPQDALQLPDRGPVQEGCGSEYPGPAVGVRFPSPCCVSPSPRLPQGFSGRGWGAPASPSPWPFFPQSYLHTFAYNNTVYLDLWNHLQKVSKSQLPAAIFGGS